MINEITIECIVTREPWSYNKDVFFRIASYCDMDLPAKPDISSLEKDWRGWIFGQFPAF